MTSQATCSYASLVPVLAVSVYQLRYIQHSRDQGHAASTGRDTMQQYTIALRKVCTCTVSATISMIQAFNRALQISAPVGTNLWDLIYQGRCAHADETHLYFKGRQVGNCMHAQSCSPCIERYACLLNKSVKHSLQPNQTDVPTTKIKGSILMLLTKCIKESDFTPQNVYFICLQKLCKSSSLNAVWHLLMPGFVN